MSFCGCAKTRNLLKLPELSYCSRSRRRLFTVLDFKSWAHSLIYGHFLATFVLHMRRNGYLWTSGVNLDTAVRFADHDFLLKCKISAIWRRFPLSFCILYAECPPYFHFRFVWPTDLESISHALTPMSIIPTKFEVANLASKYEDPAHIRHRVMSYNVSSCGRVRIINGNQWETL